MASTVKASELVTLFQKAYSEKWGYIWGGYGQVYTQKAQDNATREQTIKWGQKWVGKRVADCSGLFYWAYKELGGYMYHGSNSMWSKYTTSSKGKLVGGARDDGKPLKAGTAVFLVKGTDRHHVGMYVGDGKVIEAKGTYYGVVRSSITSWDEWGELIDTDYGDGNVVSSSTSSTQTTTSGGNKVTLTLDTLKNGSKGEQVKTVQRILNGSGFNSGKVDGIFGKGTQAAVTSFQSDKGLTADGIVGQATWSKLVIG